MDYIRIQPVTEAEFDSVVVGAGGRRIKEEGSADYLFPEAVVEFKMVQEEGLEKDARRQKIAELFRKTQPTAPTVVIEPDLLGPAEARAYYNAVAGPIKAHVKKAASQLEITRNRIDPNLIRVLVILNRGYTALNQDEFKSISLKCVHNDTTKIDWLVVGGLYYHSDTFDSYFLAPLEGIAIDVRCAFPSLGALQTEWGKLVEQNLTNMMRASQPLEVGKMPVLDLVFEIDGVRYVKPSPPMPRSSFWPGGRRPRANSSGIVTCPPVALTFPKLSKTDWESFKNALPNASTLRTSFDGWSRLQQSEDAKHMDVLQPFVPIPVTFTAFMEWITLLPSDWEFAHLCEYAAEVFDKRVRAVVDAARDQRTATVMPAQYVRLVVREIGEDKANDLSSIYYVSEIPGFERVEVIVEDQRMFWEHGIMVAAAYAVKRDVEAVLYARS